MVCLDILYRVGCVQFCQSHESEALEQHLTDQTPGWLKSEIDPCRELAPTFSPVLLSEIIGLGCLRSTLKQRHSNIDIQSFMKKASLN